MYTDRVKYVQFAGRELLLACGRSSSSSQVQSNQLGTTICTANNQPTVLQSRGLI
jgi:hypothetical protein